MKPISKATRMELAPYLHERVSKKGPLFTMLLSVSVINGWPQIVADQRQDWTARDRKLHIDSCIIAVGLYPMACCSLHIYPLYKIVKLPTRALLVVPQKNGELTSLVWDNYIYQEYNSLF